MNENDKSGSELNDGLGAAGAVMPCGAIVTNVYEAYEAGKKEERKACAKLCEELANRAPNSEMDGGMLVCAAFIRRRESV